MLREGKVSLHQGETHWIYKEYALLLGVSEDCLGNNQN